MGKRHTQQRMFLRTSWMKVASTASTFLKGIQIWLRTPDLDLKGHTWEISTFLGKRFRFPVLDMFIMFMESWQSISCGKSWAEDATPIYFLTKLKPRMSSIWFQSLQADRSMAEQRALNSWWNHEKHFKRLNEFRKWFFLHVEDVSRRLYPRSFAPSNL